MTRLNFSGPVVLAILDGVGLAPDGAGNAVSRARTPFLDAAFRDHLNIPLEASGAAVGILPGTMGNSEVGHNALGSGQIIKHEIAKIEDAFNTGEIFTSRAWQGAIANVVKNTTPAHPATLHFSGIFSDGNVHSSIAHLEKLIIRAAKSGIKKVRFHLVFDGRDVPPQSEPKYIDRLEAFVKPLNDAGLDYRIASGAGRMVAIADRYESDWSMVEKGWRMLFYGEAPYAFHDARSAVLAFREKDSSLQDQYLPPFVVVDAAGAPVGRVEKGDSFIYFDFRADRAIEIAQAFTYYDFPYFSRGDYLPDDIFFAGMTEYNADTHVPEYRLVEPVSISDPLNTFLGVHNVSQFAVSESVKFGHITYYFNGNSYDPAPGEVFTKVESDTLPFDTRPWMKSAEIADSILEHLESFKFLRLNFPGGDMVGHFAEMGPTMLALESIDLALSRIAKKVDELGGILVITADHGNAEELLDSAGNPKTSHSLNKVPCLFCDNTSNHSLYSQNLAVSSPGLSNVAATLATLLGFDPAELPASWQPSLISIV